MRNLGTICPKAVSLGCRSPPFLCSVHPPTHELNGGNTNDDHQSEGFLTHDEYIEVSNEVAAELKADKLYEAAYQRRTTRNKAQYSLDCDDGIEYSACLHEPTPQELLDRMELFVHLWNALNSLPEVQGVRVEAHLILGKSYRQIAREQGVDKSAVRHSVKSGKAAMRKYLKKFL